MEVPFRNPELHLTAEVDAATGLIDIKTDWTGDVGAIAYSVLVEGGQIGSYVLKDYPSEWLLSVSSYNEATAAEFYLSATGMNTLSGINDLIAFSVSPLSDSRDVRISLSPVDISYPAAPDTPDVLEPEISYIIKFGADVSAVSANVSQAEGNEPGSWVEYEIVLDRAVDVDHQLSWMLVSSGANPVTAADFAGDVLPGGILSFAAGETAGVIRFQVAADGLVERDETFEIALTSSNGLNVSALGTLSGTLVNDDKAAVSVVGDSVLLPEGDSGITSYTFDIELDQAAFGEQSVDWAVELIDGEASLADFSGPLSGTVTFAEGETSKQITLGVVGDVEKEGREDFRIKVTPQSEDILVDIDAGVLDVQIKDDDGYDLGGQVYFWGKGDPAKQYLMDGVDVGLTVATDNVPEELYASAVNLKNLKLNAETGQSTAEVWTDFENMSAVEFSCAVPEGSTFVSALGSGWTVVETLDSGVYGLNAVWNGADNSQTADRLKLGTFTFDTPALGADVQLNVLSAAVGNDAGESKTNASPIRMSIGYESQTVVSSADSAADGAYSLSSLAEGGYQVMLDKDFELYTISEQTGGKIWSSEAKAVNVFDARATLLIASGKEASSEALIAADVDGSGSVNVFDARAILLMSSRNETALDRSLEWVFVAEDADLSGVERRTVKEGVDWEQGSSILLDDDAAHQNLVAILRGDVDGSYRPEDDLILFA